VSFLTFAGYCYQTDSCQQKFDQNAQALFTH
jgi:hypothetical protein